MPAMALPLWQARGPRFLALLLGLWVLVRLASYWPGEAPAVPPPSPFDDMPAYGARPLLSDGSVPALANQASRRVPASLRPLALLAATAKQTSGAATGTAPSGYSSTARHAWRLALLQRFGPRSDSRIAVLALPNRAAGFASGFAPLQPVPHWTPEASMRRWSLAVASYWRSGGQDAPPIGPAGTARLSSSQTAVRLTYLIDPHQSLRAYVRATHTPGLSGGADVAVGVALRPVRGLPVDVHIEQRSALAGDGRDTTLLFTAGGVDNQPLPLDFRLSAYAQAGVADFGETVAFADGSVAVQREVAARGGVRLSLGTMVAAAIQPGARRIDAGPRATLALPELGQGAQIALDWRERVAGNARPGSGLALTLAADF
jgi:hypothetical protein